MKKILRKYYRNKISVLTKKVLQIHEPTVIAVMGDGQTSVAREMIYKIIHTEFPARRNLEFPEAEFSIPFTVLGYPKYPSSLTEFLWVLVKTWYLTKKIEPYKHFLIIELNILNKEILDHWLNILKPETLMIVGNSLIDHSNYKFKKIVKIAGSGNDDLFSPIKMGVEQIARFYRLDPVKTQEELADIHFPESKIRMFPGVNKSMIIDGTYHYYPFDIDSVFELVDTKEEKVIVFTENKKDVSFIKEKNVSCLLNPKNYKPEKDDVVILRGLRGNTLSQYKNLIDSKHPIF